MQRLVLVLFIAGSLGASALADTAVAVADTANIINSGSTNTPGWNIAVTSDAQASLAVLNTTKTYALPSDVAANFFSDLAKAKESALPVLRGCIKSVSFGSRTTVNWNGWTSPDLSCPTASGSPFAALAADLGQIQKTVDVNSVVEDIRHPVRQQSANLPLCTTPDGRYKIQIYEVDDHLHFFAEVTDLQSAVVNSDPAYDFYDISGFPAFTGKGKSAQAEPISLTLANPDYDQTTDASFSMTFIDSRRQNDGVTPVDPAARAVSYDHLTCTRWYR